MTGKNPLEPKIIFPLIIGLILGLIAGLAFTKVRSTTPQKVVLVEPSNTSKVPDSFFTDQTALINGKVTAVTKDSITVENWQKQTSAFSVNQPVYISDQSNTNQTPSTDITKVPLNQFVIINLKKVNNQYLVSSIVITPPTGTPPPLPSFKPAPPAK